MNHFHALRIFELEHTMRLAFVSRKRFQLIASEIGMRLFRESDLQLIPVVASSVRHLLRF